MKELSPVQVSDTLCEETIALVDAAAGQHHVRERMLRPRLLAPALERRECRALGVIQQMTLLVSEGRHAVRIRHIAVLPEHLEHGAQHLPANCRD